MKNLLDEFAVNDPVEVSIIWSVVEIDWFSFILCDVDCVLRQFKCVFVEIQSIFVDLICFHLLIQELKERSLIIFVTSTEGFCYKVIKCHS